MAIDVKRNQDRSRYELRLDDDLVGVVDYFLVDGGPMVLSHTEVLPAYRGRGLGRRLVQDALDDVRRSGLTVVAQCSYAASFIDSHPEYRELVGERVTPVACWG